MTKDVTVTAAANGRRPLAGVLALLCLLVLTRAWLMAGSAHSGFSDNLMRLVEVRDWLGGQGWFDVQQYRLLPPEGVSMHWSRYVDAGIAGLLLPLSWLMPMSEAETLTLILWPTLLLVLFCAVVAVGTHRLFGTLAALVAGLVAVLWAKLGAGKFVPGSLDHHNVQLLFSTLVLFLTVVPARDAARGSALQGAAAGCAAAFSLAVGLEMLPVLLLLWGLAALRLAFGARGSRAWLGGYALAILVAAPALMAGQTPPAEWRVPYCDELAPPMLAVLAAGVAASLAGVGLAGRVASPMARLGLMAGVAALGLWLAAPLAGPCLDGPYGAMSDAARRVITDRISEAQPAWRSFAAFPFGVNALVTPVLAAILLAAGLGWHARDRLTASQRQALLIALAPAVIGVGLGMIQIRALSVAAPAVPLLAGFVAAQVHGLISAGRQRAGSLLGIAAVVFIFLPELPLLAVMHLAPQEKVGAASGKADPDAWEPLSGACREPETLAELAAISAALPAGSILLSELNFGAMVLAHTSLATTSAGYHRSGDAFLNGVAPFQDSDAMVAALHKSRASHVVICRGGGGGGPFGEQLLRGNLPGWLQPEPAAGATLLLLRVDAATLPPGTGTGLEG